MIVENIQGNYLYMDRQDVQNSWNGLHSCRPPVVVVHYRIRQRQLVKQAMCTGKDVPFLRPFAGRSGDKGLLAKKNCFKAWLVEEPLVQKERRGEDR